ncbi:hypothetical protein EVAR_21277_1 [Eumeta japonica]|uniref:Uncharacterized protein n=1 Tax=Eumeta variegata TaxID=151549 RepID=A0A4C1WL13_EUMVA|nr:hypothetical protein EVAR_21277_1 [Eumeta japonica]
MSLISYEMTSEYKMFKTQKVNLSQCNDQNKREILHGRNRGRVNSAPLWEDFISKATKLHSALRWQIRRWADDNTRRRKSLDKVRKDRESWKRMEEAFTETGTQIS